MDQQRDDPVVVGLVDTEYKYICHIRGSESFSNVLRREGIAIPETLTHVSFASDKRLDMKGFKERGLIWSYSIIRVRRDEEIIEEG